MPDKKTSVDRTPYEARRGPTMNIESIEKVSVSRLSPVLRFTRELVGEQPQTYGVYLIFNNPVRFFLGRDYCKIGRAAGEAQGLRGRLIGNYNWHKRPDEDCGALETHYFQTLECRTPSDAGRLEALFHLWHGRYPGGRNPIEPKRSPKATREPDFFELGRPTPSL